MIPLWFHIFKEIVLHLPNDESARQQMLDASRHYYRDNESQLKHIDEFELKYRSADAIRWYTKACFVYRLVNKALRTEDVEQLYLFRYFIQDLCNALIVEHQVMKELTDSVIVYRGLRMTQAEFDKLVRDKQQLISMNGFLSTTLTCEVAEMYAGKPDPASDKLSVLLEINCDVEQLGDSVIFAFIESQSAHQDEKEVLFDIGSTLRFESTLQNAETGVWHIKMTVNDEGREVMRSYLGQCMSKAPTTCFRIQYGVLLFEMGKYNSSLLYFEQLLAKPQDENLSLIHMNIGRALGVKGDKNAEWKHYEYAYKLAMESDPPLLNEAAESLNDMGAWCSDRCENDRALDYHTRALQIVEQLYGSVDGRVIEILLCIGTCHEHKGDYNRALKFYKQAQHIQEQHGEDNRFTECRSLLVTGHALMLQCKYDESLVYYHRALDIRRHILPAEHDDIANCLRFIGNALDSQGHHQRALRYYKRTLAMYEKTLPPSELNEKSCVLNDIGNAYDALVMHRTALKYYRRSLSMKRKCFPSSDHPDIPVLIDNIGNTYSGLNRHKLALKYARKALYLRRRLLKRNHPDIAGSLNNVACAYIDMTGKFGMSVWDQMSWLKRARRCLLRAHNIWIIVGSHRPESEALVKKNLVRVKRKMRRTRRKIAKIWQMVIAQR